MKRSRSPSVPSPKQESKLPDHIPKKVKILETYTATSPFPSFSRPSPSEADQIFRVLAGVTPGGVPVQTKPSADSNAAATCGSVPNVLESLIGTILSQNTTAKNSTAAQHSLDDAFGKNDFAAIAAAPRAAVVSAITMGGLANRKAKIIQELLEVVKARHGDYDLQHLTSVPDSDAMAELVSYAGVGVKTAACVLSFCLGRQSFAVDTHVYRLSRLLNWVPPKADRVMAQAHLEVMLPPELKYGLHVMMVKHGRTCKGCKKDGKGECPLKTWLKQNRAMKEEEVEEAIKTAAREEDEAEEGRHTQQNGDSGKRRKKS